MEVALEDNNLMEKVVLTPDEQVRLPIAKTLLLFCGFQ